MFDTWVGGLHVTMRGWNAMHYDMCELLLLLVQRLFSRFSYVLHDRYLGCEELKNKGILSDWQELTPISITDIETNCYLSWDIQYYPLV